jgi:hypothetical protein
MALNSGSDQLSGDSMPTYSESGTENLQANFTVFDATTSGAYEKDESAGSGGKDAQGDETNAVTLSNPGKSAPSGGADRHPDGVQTFTEGAT